MPLEVTVQTPEQWLLESNTRPLSQPSRSPAVLPATARPFIRTRDDVSHRMLCLNLLVSQ